MKAPDLDFFRQRMSQEEEAALAAKDEPTASIHRELAERYAALLRTYDADENDL